jgi:hypothetical protein
VNALASKIDSNVSKVDVLVNKEKDKFKVEKEKVKKGKAKNDGGTLKSFWRASLWSWLCCVCPPWSAGRAWCAVGRPVALGCGYNSNQSWWARSDHMRRLVCVVIHSVRVSP